MKSEVNFKFTNLEELYVRYKISNSLSCIYTDTKTVVSTKLLQVTQASVKRHPPDDFINEHRAFTKAWLTRLFFGKVKLFTPDFDFPLISHDVESTIRCHKQFKCVCIL